MIQKSGKRNQQLLTIVAWAEAATGIVLLINPPLAVRLLFDAEIAGAGLIASRIAGIALIGLGLACWPRRDATDSHSRAFLGMLTYNFMATLYLGYVALVIGSVGILLWPAIVLHAVSTILLALTWFRNRRLASRR